MTVLLRAGRWGLLYTRRCAKLLTYSVLLESLSPVLWVFTAHRSYTLGHWGSAWLRNVPEETVLWVWLRRQTLGSLTQNRVLLPVGLCFLPILTEFRAFWTLGALQVMTGQFQRAWIFLPHTPGPLSSLYQHYTRPLQSLWQYQELCPAVPPGSDSTLCPKPGCKALVSPAPLPAQGQALDPFQCDSFTASGPAGWWNLWCSCPWWMPSFLISWCLLRRG